MTTKTIEITAEYELITPLFSSGADPKVAEWRLPSFKGVLRWFWRAIVWRRFGGDLAAIRRTERRLFGSTDTGRGAVTLRLVGATPAARGLTEREVLKDGPAVVGMGARYLGYGVMESFASSKKNVAEGELSRACMLPPCSVRVALRCRSLGDDDLETLLLALRAFGLLGGMGSKSRKGYGSLALTSLIGGDQARWQAPHTLAELERAIRGLYAGAKASSDLAPYTALTPGSRHVLLAGRRGMSALKLLDHVGRELVRYRSWGRDGQVLGDQPSERRFRRDHDLMKGRPVGPPLEHPERVVFGLPHNYTGQPLATVGVFPLGKEKPIDRRASPLLIHVHRCHDVPVAVISFLPARFLPEGRKLQVGPRAARLMPERELWRPIEDLLERFPDRPDARGGPRQESFAQAVEVRP